MVQLTKEVDILNWKDVLKWQPDKQYKLFPPYKTKDSGEEISRIHESLTNDETSHPVLVAGHYLFRGSKRIKRDIESYELHDWSLEILSRKGETARQNWFYRSPTDSQVFMFDVTPPNEVLPQQSETETERKIKNLTGVDVIVFTTVYPDKKKPSGGKWFNMWNEPKEREEESQRINPFSQDQLLRAKTEIDGLKQSNDKDRNTIRREQRLASQKPKKGKRPHLQKIEDANNRIEARKKSIARLEKKIKEMEKQG